MCLHGGRLAAHEVYLSEIILPRYEYIHDALDLSVLV